MNADNPLVSIIAVTVRRIDFRGVRLHEERGRGGRRVVSDVFLRDNETYVVFRAFAIRRQLSPSR